MLYKVVITFKSVAEILKRNHSNENYWAVLCDGNICFPKCKTKVNLGQGSEVSIFTDLAGYKQIVD